MLRFPPRLTVLFVTAVSFGPPLLWLSPSAPAAAATTSEAARPAAPQSNTGSSNAKTAPADEYFGTLQMSVLGIRNTLRNAAANAEQRAASDAANTFKNLSFVEDSLRDWQTKYPADSWLPRMLLGLQRVYTKIATEESSRRAIDVASWLIQRYPRSAEAVTLRAEFASAMTHQAAVTQAQAAAPQTQAQAAAPPTQAQAAAGPTTAGTQVTTGH